MTISRRRTNRRSSNSAGEAERISEPCGPISNISVPHARLKCGIENVNAEIDQHIDAGPAGAWITRWSRHFGDDGTAQQPGDARSVGTDVRAFRNAC